MPVFKDITPDNASVTLTQIRATNELRLNRLRMTTELSKFVGRYDFSTEHNEFTIKMLENEQGKVRTATDRRDLVRSATNQYDPTTDPIRSGTGKYELERSATKQ
ncbi:hypothetical protein DPMN_084285 [Dreissena polymorpha]|uniref:Uncharacterized protein n=1 Tax=Dreissena polymorpha TaxID=45954 RepID=A0A9D3YBH9_DREPO|nr:hypothetical protein DPMN_084285 [Dreissena polymorpha]